MIDVRGITLTPISFSIEAPAKKNFWFFRNSDCGFARNLSFDTLSMTARTESQGHEVRSPLRETRCRYPIQYASATVRRKYESSASCLSMKSATSAREILTVKM